jgi:hypothetical protein
VQKCFFGFSPLERGDADRQWGKKDHAITKNIDAKFIFLFESGNLSYTL